MFEATGEADGTDDGKYQTQVTQLFAQVGGIVFLTLVVNGTASGPLLNKLGLAKSPDSRTRLLKQLEKHFRKQLVDEFVKLLAHPRFKDVDFPVVQHVPYLNDLTFSDLKAACLRNPKHEPSLHHLPYFDTDGQDLSWANMQPSSEVELPLVLEKIPETAPATVNDEQGDIRELRHFFLEILGTVYNTQMENGELNGRNSFVSYSLVQSLDFASSDVDKGLPLCDWKAAHITDKYADNRWIESGAHHLESTINKPYCCIRYSKERVGDDRAHTLEYTKLKVNVLRALSFIEAHRQARKTFTLQLSDSSVVDTTAHMVLDESKAETDAAQEDLNKLNKDDRMIITAHYFCAILLNNNGKYVTHLLKEGILQPKEAAKYLGRIETLLISAKQLLSIGQARRRQGIQARARLRKVL